MYEHIVRVTEMVASGISRCAFIKGRGRVGKTYQVLATLRKLGLENGKDFLLISGYITNLQLYEKLYAGRDMRVIVIDDVGMLLRRLTAIDLLKQATDGRGEVSWQTTIDTHAPPSFSFRAGVIMTFNSVPAANMVDVEALFERGHFVTVAPCREDLFKTMMAVCSSEWQKQVTAFLKKLSLLHPHTFINLSTQQRAFELYRHCGARWKKAVMEDVLRYKAEGAMLFYEFTGGKNVLRADFAKYLVYRLGISKRTAERRIEEWVALGELLGDGKKWGQMLASGS